MTQTTLQTRSLTTTRNGRFLLFGVLYFVQGTLLAYVLVFNNLYLRNFGASAAQLSLLNGLLVLPFIFKIGIGLLSDKRPLNLPLLGRGHRLPYMTLGLLMTTLGGGLATFVHPVDQYVGYLAVALFIAFGLAFYDTTADGLAVDTTPPAEYELVQGTMMIGRALGFVAMAAVYGRLIVTYDWTIVFWIVIVLSLLPHAWLRHVREPAQRAAAQQFTWTALRALWRPEIGWFSAYAVVYSIAVYGANAIVTLFANEELGGTIVQVGDVAALGGIGMLLGAAAATLLSHRISIWRQGVLTATMVSGTLVLIAVTATLDNIAAITVLWGICLAAAELVYLTLAMAKTDPRLGAGQFAIFMAISNAGTGIGQATATGLIDTIPFSWIFLGLALTNVLAFPLIAIMRADARGKARQVRIEPETP